MNDAVATQVQNWLSRPLLLGLVGAAPVAAFLAHWQAHDGEDRELLLRHPGEVIARFGGGAAITVYRLTR